MLKRQKCVKSPLRSTCFDLRALDHMLAYSLRTIKTPPKALNTLIHPKGIHFIPQCSKKESTLKTGSYEVNHEVLHDCVMAASYVRHGFVKGA